MATCSVPAQFVCAAPAESLARSCSTSANAGIQCVRCTGAWSRATAISVSCAIIGKGNVAGKRSFLGRSFRVAQVDAAVSVSGGARFSGVKVEAAERFLSGRLAGRSYVLSSTLCVQEGKEEEVASLCREIVKWGQEKIKDESSGISVFECNVDAFENNVIHFWERYESTLNMNDIRASPEHTKFMNDVRPFLTGPIGLAAYEYRDGCIGHMMNPIGPKGEGGLDDATGQSGTKQQSSSIGQGLVQMEEDDSNAWGLDKLLAKVRGEDKEAGWSFKTLFGDIKKGD